MGSRFPKKIRGSLIFLVIMSSFFISTASANYIDLEGNLNNYWRFDDKYQDYSENSNSLVRKGTSLYFDGKNDWVDIDIQDSPKWQYTLSTWVKPQDKTSRIIFRRAHCSALYFDSSNVRLYLKDSNHNTDNVDLSNTNVNEGEWNFIAASVNLNDSKAKIFVNGDINTKSIDLNDSTSLMSGGGQEDFLGGGSQLNGCPQADYFKGWMDNFRFYGESLSIDQMQSLYEDKNIAAKEIGVWPISSGSGDLVQDYSSNNYSGKIVKGNNLLNNSGFESGTDSTGNMDRIRTNYAGSSWISDYSLYGEYSGRHNKTGEDDQWSAVEWSLSSLNTSTEYLFSASYKCSGDVSSDNTAFSIDIFNGTGWHLEDRTNFDYNCNGRWDTVSGRVGSDISVLQDSNKVRFRWTYSTNPGQMFVDNISLRKDGPEWSNEGFGSADASFSKGILGTKSTNFGSVDSYIESSEINLQGDFSVSAWIKPEDASQIGTKNNPGKSCLHILENGGSQGNGVYWIDAEGSDTGKFEVYCDMETDGGGWTLVASFSDGSFFQDCSNSNVDLEYGSNCYSSCSEFTDDSDGCDNTTEKDIQDAEMRRLEDKYVIENEYGNIDNWQNSDYVSPAYNQLKFSETLFKDEYQDFIGYNFSNPSYASMNNVNYSLESMSNFYRSANTHHLQLRFQHTKSSINPSDANDCGNLEIAIMGADNDGGSVNYYTSNRKYSSFSGARAGPMWDSANNGGCRFDDAGGRWTSRRLGGQKNTQSNYLSWFVRKDSTPKEAGIAQKSYSISSSSDYASTSIDSSRNLFTEGILGDWRNIVFVHDSSQNTKKLFVNGILRDESASTVDLDAVGPLYLGKFFEGEMDEIRVYNRSLTESEIASLSFS